jgi:hypothetical protein
VIQNRRQRPATDGQAIHTAEVASGGVTFPWVCVCRPHNNHDHDAALTELDAKLERRAEWNSKNRLIGNGFEMCDLRPLGPKKWRLDVRFRRTDGVLVGLCRDYEDPKDAMNADAIREALVPV